MSKIQKNLLVIYLALTVTVLVLDHLWPASVYVRLYKNLIMFSLFLASQACRKRHLIQEPVSLAILFAATGDLCFALGTHGIWLFSGLGAFFLAYILLILVFRRRLLPSITEVFLAVPVLLFTARYYLFLRPYIPQELHPFTPFSALFLTLVCWCGLCTVPQKVFQKRPALFCAFAGCLILISDAAISAGVFLPPRDAYFDPWLFNIIWGAFIPAWTLMAAFSLETDLYRRKKN